MDNGGQAVPLPHHDGIMIMKPYDHEAQCGCQGLNWPSARCFSHYLPGRPPAGLVACCRWQLSHC